MYFKAFKILQNGLANRDGKGKLVPDCCTLQKSNVETMAETDVLHFRVSVLCLVPTLIGLYF